KNPKQPVRKYVHQDMAHWIARMLARPELESVMDSRTRHAGQRSSEDNVDMRDIWDGNIFRDFKDQDGTRFFVETEEGRYAFSLNVDGFNPEGNLHGGRSASVTGIYMVCLNLPVSLRYKAENAYLVGVIP
ncbi:hypothetical protein SISNIDRAFT_389916, partial [Sistotremastrum niveocremeum HHB9708]